MKMMMVIPHSRPILDPMFQYAKYYGDGLNALS